MGGMGGGITKVLKAANPFTSPKEHLSFVSDPGGLFHTSKNSDIAQTQAMIDLGGIGSKGVLEGEATKRADALQNEAVAKQQAILDKQTESESASLTRKRKLASGGGAMSLLSGSMLGTDKKKVLG